MQFKHLGLADSEVHEAMFQCYMKLALHGERCFEEDKVSRFSVLSTALSIYILGTSKNKTQGPEYEKKISDYAAVHSAIINADHEIEPTRILNEVKENFDIFQKGLEEDVLTQRSATFNMQCELLAFDTIIQCMQKPVTLNHIYIRETIQRFKARLDDAFTFPDLRQQWIVYLDKYLTFLYIVCQSQKDIFKNYEVALIAITEAILQAKFLEDNPQIKTKIGVANLYQLHYDVYIERKEYGEALEIAVKIAVLGLNKRDSSSAANLYLATKKRWYDQSSKAVAANTMLKDARNLDLDEHQKQALAVIEIVASKKYPEFRVAQDSLTADLPTLTLHSPPEMTLVLLIEKVWTNFFLGTGNEDDKFVKEAHVVVQELEGDKRKLYTGFIKFWEFLVIWRKRKADAAQVLGDGKENKDLNNPDAAEEDRLRPFGKVIGLEEDQKLFKLVWEALDLFQSVEQLPPESYYLNGNVVMATVQTISEVLKYSGNNRKYVESLQVLLRWARTLESKAMIATAMSELVKMCNISSHSRHFMTEFNAIVKGFMESNKKLKFVRLKALLASAWFIHNLGDNGQAVRVAATLYEHPDLHRGSLQATLIQAEATLLLARCKCARSGYRRVNSVFKDNEVSQQKVKEIEEGGPIDLGTNAVKFAASCLNVHYFGPKAQQDIERIGMYFRSISLSFEARKLVSDVYKWVGLGLEQALLNKVTLAVSTVVVFASK